MAKVKELAKRGYFLDEIDIDDKTMFDHLDDGDAQPSQVFTLKVKIVTAKGTPTEQDVLPFYPEENVPIITEKGVPLVQEKLPEFKEFLPPEVQASDTPQVVRVSEARTQPISPATKNEASLPNTGTENTSSWTLLGLFSLLGLAGLTTNRRKKNQEK
ncbi:hypothetical protein STRDD10_02045 [Streptococcus sp. DD10]|nr:hypothetical protein STRDD10_02045 [Streptococcus sp. DD10]